MDKGGRLEVFKRIMIYIFTGIMGGVIAIIVGLTINPILGKALFSILSSVFILKILYDFLNSSILRKRIIRKENKKYNSLYEWTEADFKGYGTFEKKLLKKKPKYNFLNNLELIREELVKLGKLKVKLLSAHLKVIEKNLESYDLIVKTLITLGTGVLLWYIKEQNAIVNVHVSKELDYIINTGTWVFYFIISIFSIINNNLRTSYKIRIILELIDTIEDEDYPQPNKVK
ncbi:3-hydroxyisobutyrate dehydrogenase [Bacillus cereus]|uniref:3-hydroxyisobutyrate dehydrogenase n=2 Tax=Bacteria TaxID=2 RepID=UPI00294F88E7|nr:3-hydroxyisobutyrate dehydrogenase [Bacillus cereus]MDV6364118.1 3-hydroxyisobutyrate dehydrogenase [Bacillus cereus]